MDLGWSELLVIGIVALIVVGPKDLPGMFRTLGRFTAKVRRMAREFTRAMEDAADEAGVKETAKDLKAMTSPSKLGLNTLKEAARDLDPTKPSEAAKAVGPETAKLAEERAESARQAQENAKLMAEQWKSRKAAEAADAAAGETPKPAAPKDTKEGEASE